MDLFESIDRVKKDLPKLKTVSHDVKEQNLNIYQIVSLIIFIICLLLGILFGNLFPICGSSSGFYGGVCLSTEFNFSLMLLIWFIAFLVCMFFYAIGHIIALLTSINNKLGKK